MAVPCRCPDVFAAAVGPQLDRLDERRVMLPGAHLAGHAAAVPRRAALRILVKSLGCWNALNSVIIRSAAAAIRPGRDAETGAGKRMQTSCQMRMI